jgi:polyhydroxyalkanoate synthase subunit PhaC
MAQHQTLPPIALRAAPRPLPLHLMAQVSTLLASQAALPLLKNGSLPWRPNLAAAAEALRQSLAAAGPDSFDAFARAVTAEAFSRHQHFLDGIDAYRRHPYHRTLPPPPPLWSAGTTRVLDYRENGDATGGQPVLVIPSLVNRAYILDLTRNRSVMRYLAARGLAPFLVDWDAPGADEAGFTLTDYVAGRLDSALDAVIAATGRKPAVMGYCMGGMLAMALAQRRPDAVAGLTLLATPWDFHAAGPAQAAMMRALAEPLGDLLQNLGVLPVDMLQSLFMGLDPGLSARKYAAFTHLKRRSARARDFVALEEWANDGVPLAGPVARECLFRWYGDNDPAAGRWSIADRPVLPQQVQCPTLVVVPARDRIVPPESALPLAAAIPGAKLMTARGGHVGMLLTSRAKTEVYGPIARWLIHLSPQ